MSIVVDHLPRTVRLTHTRYGLMLYPAQDMYIGPCLETYGEYSPDEADALRQMLKPGDVVLEVGANIGAHTIALSRFVGSEGRIYAIEPQRCVFQMLCANIAINDLGNIHARQQGLGASPETLWVSSPGAGKLANFGGIALEREGKEPVDVVTMDSLALEKLDLIKIDVEGMEEAVLRGGVDTVARLRPILYVENDNLERSASLIRTIRALGYRMWWHVPSLVNPDNFRKVSRNIFPIVYLSFNMICVPIERSMNTGLVEVLKDDDRPAY